MSVSVTLSADTQRRAVAGVYRTFVDRVYLCLFTLTVEVNCEWRDLALLRKS
jgi:hypothetical protein